MSIVSSGPARAGALIYAKDPDRLAGFYESVLGMVQLHADAEHVVLDSPDMQLIIHAIPAQFAARVTIAVPPRPREAVAIKLFFTVPSLAEARNTVQNLGGNVFDDEWQGPGFRVRNGCDPEGNVFQIRECVA